MTQIAINDKIVSAIGEDFKKFSQSSQIKKCVLPNICLLKSCRGHHLIIGFNRRVIAKTKNIFLF
jgi:hypothetical protein